VKLYLSSYGLGNEPEALQRLVNSNNVAAVICNAQDSTSYEERAERVQRGLDEMMSLGFSPEELDLRDYFNDRGKLPSELAKYGLLWIRGGNSFVLRRAMKQSGFDKAIEPLVTSEAIVYAGYSAGTCVAAPTLHGLELVDDPHDIPKGYDKDIVWNGLHFISKSVAPHYRSDHPEAAAIEQTVEYFEKHHIDYLTLRDGEAMVVNGNELRIVG